MPMVATMKPYTLFVSEDDMPPNPRTDYNNFGKMLCWHSRYSLGDKHNFDEPGEFLEKQLFDIYSSYPSSEYGKPVYDFIKSGKAETARLEYDKSAREWVLYEKWFVGSGWSKSSSYAAALKGKDMLILYQTCKQKRTFYKITDSGLEYLQQETQKWKNYTGAVNKVLGK